MYLFMFGYFFNLSFVRVKVIKVKTWINSSNGGSMALVWELELIENKIAYKSPEMSISTIFDLVIINCAISIFIFYAYLVSRSVMQTGLAGLPRTD